MPELPEVEIVARSLEEIVTGRLVVAAKLYRQLLAPSVTPETFSKVLKNNQIIAIGRRGKHILIGFSEEKTLIVHLRMSGRFMLLNEDRENPKFTHAEFNFSDGSRLVFQDQRHFGYMNIVRTASLFEAPELKKLAPEPFSEKFSRKYLKNVLAGSRRPVKEFLLDQTKVCGLGNIYTSEALFLARVNPLTPAKAVSSIKANRLHRRIREVLSQSIEAASNARLDPQNIEDRYFNGSSNGDWLVYNREGAPCPGCGRKVVRVKQGARSSFYCPRCQPK